MSTPDVRVQVPPRPPKKKDIRLDVFLFLCGIYRRNLHSKRFVFCFLRLKKQADQNILLDNKSDDEKEKSLKLIGYSNMDKEVLKEFDSNYMDSAVIDGIKTNNDGSFSSNSIKKMLTDEQIDKVLEITKEKINDTLNKILDAKFDINPKYNKGNIGCEFCKYKDLCFMKEYDFKKIESSDIFDE